MATQKKTAEVDYSMQEKILALYELHKIREKSKKVKGPWARSATPKQRLAQLNRQFAQLDPADLRAGIPTGRRGMRSACRRARS